MHARYAEDGPVLSARRRESAERALRPVWNGFLQLVPAWRKRVATQEEIKALVTQMVKGDMGQKREAASALEKMGKEGLPALIWCLKRPERQTRRMAARAITKMGEAAIPTLEKAAREDDPEIRKQVAYVLGEIGPPAIPVLTQLLGDPEASVRAQVASAIGVMMGDGKAALPAVKEALANEQDPNVKQLLQQASDSLEGGTSLLSDSEG